MHRFRIQLWQAFLALTLVAFALWMTTQAGMEACEIEVDEVVIEDVSADPNPRQEISKVRYRYLMPESRVEYGVVLFLNRTWTQNPVQVGDRFRFRHRSRNLFWLPYQNPDEIAIELLGLKPENIEELITEKNWPEP